VSNEEDSWPKAFIYLVEALVFCFIVWFVCGR
jgi:hypothetical protein